MGTDDAQAGARILVVDDEDSITQLLCTALRYEGFETASAATGREALTPPPLSGPTSSCSTSCSPTSTASRCTAA